MAHSITKQLLFASFALISLSAQAENQNLSIDIAANSIFVKNYKVEITDITSSDVSKLAEQNIQFKFNMVFSKAFNKAFTAVEMLKMCKDSTKIAKLDGKILGILVITPMGSIEFCGVSPIFPLLSNRDDSYKLLEKMLEVAQKNAQKNNVDRLSLYIRRNKKSEIEFFKKCGFEVTLDAGTDTIYMSKLLTDKSGFFCGTEILDTLRNNPAYAKKS